MKRHKATSRTKRIERIENELKDSIQQTLNLLPEEALVGLVTFGTMVHVHEIGFQECPKSYVFKGSKDIPVAEVKELLGLGPGGAGGDPRMRQQHNPSAQAGRFLQPVRGRMSNGLKRS